MTVDMNAVRAARREALGKGPTVKIGQESFQCPPDLPFDALVAGNQAERGDISQTYDFVRELMGESGVKALRSWKPSLEEMTSLVGGLLEEYGQKRKNGDGSEEGDGEESGEARD